MRSDFTIMSQREITRLEAMQRLQSGSLTQNDVSRQLGISVRQVKRLWRAYREQGAHGLVSHKRGRPGNHRTDPILLQRALDLVAHQYPDFGPTLAARSTAYRKTSLFSSTERFSKSSNQSWQDVCERHRSSSASTALGPSRSTETENRFAIEPRSALNDAQPSSTVNALRPHHPIVARFKTQGKRIRYRPITLGNTLLVALRIRKGTF